ncbi:MAG TPA: flagellar FlbD family protein [Firmicutes bacterium]|nr:flagellar FlbD family protein [Bacillota bacterium]
MITLHRLDGKEFVINADLIETVEATPDTVVTLSNGHKYLVREPVAAVVRESVRYRRRLSGLRRRKGGSPVPDFKED